MESWRNNLAYLPQETFLINTSIAENIAIGEIIDSKIESKINDAINKAGLRHVIDDLENGIFTQIGEKGLMLSGGQRQGYHWLEPSIRREIFLFLMNLQVPLMLNQLPGY